MIETRRSRRLRKPVLHFLRQKSTPLLHSTDIRNLHLRHCSQFANYSRHDDRLAWHNGRNIGRRFYKKLKELQKFDATFFNLTSSLPRQVNKWLSKFLPVVRKFSEKLIELVRYYTGPKFIGKNWDIFKRAHLIINWINCNPKITLRCQFAHFL